MRGMKAQAAVSARCRALGENGDEVMFSLGQCPGVASSPALMRKLLKAFGKMMEAQHLSSSLPPVYDPFTEDSRSWKSSRLLTLCRCFSSILSNVVHPPGCERSLATRKARANSILTLLMYYRCLLHVGVQSPYLLMPGTLCVQPIQIAICKGCMQVVAIRQHQMGVAIRPWSTFSSQFLGIHEQTLRAQGSALSGKIEHLSDKHLGCPSRHA